MSLCCGFTHPTDVSLVFEITEEFYINDNEVAGRMPKEICDLKLQHLVSDCLGARPEVPCECCSICCQGLPDPKCRDMGAAKKQKQKKK